MTKKPILYFVSLSLLLILGIVFLWVPKYQKIYDLRLKIKDKEIKLQKKEQYFQKLKGFSERLEGYSSEMTKINSALSSSPADIASTLRFLTNTASQNGLILTEISFERTVPLAENSAIKKTQFSFSLSGSYLAFKNFLAVLEKNSRLIVIEEISFEAPKEGKIFTFDLKIRTYSY